MALTFIKKSKAGVPEKVAPYIKKQVTHRTKFKALQDLGRERYLEIENMLMSGESPGAVTRYIREEWGVFKDKSEGAVLFLIKKFKRDRITPRIKRAAKALTATEEKVVSTIQSDLDIGKEFVELIHLQKARIKKVSEVEKKMPMLLGGLNKEISLMNQLLLGFNKYKMDLGMLDRVKGGGPLVNVNLVNSINTYQQDIKRKDEIAAATAAAMGILNDDDVIDAEGTVEDAE
ncbi:MAG: hypothetical protein GWN00_01165 [Aliifodinibius sp.]|nr:hypothetical protein [Fodinibius sp.]NIV09941.1 hypothetical protein [Fodinibius sp.]NIY23471.1 hypothetical protein [Fodinibius sp.]